MKKSLTVAFMLIPIWAKPVGALSQDGKSFVYRYIQEMLIPKPSILSLEDFLEAVAQSESNNNYSCVNKLGYLGKYQFSKVLLRDLGIKVSKEEFISNPKIQEFAMRKLLYHNKHILRKEIAMFDGKEVNGVFVTESGILAAAHLGGPKSVKLFLYKGVNKKDAMGTKVSSYMKKFSGYRLDISKDVLYF